MIRLVLFCTLLASCGIKGDPLPVTRAAPDIGESNEPMRSQRGTGAPLRLSL